MFIGVYANHVDQWTPIGRAFVVRRWESLIENWPVRNCRLDCEVTCIQQPLVEDNILQGIVT